MKKMLALLIMQIMIHSTLYASYLDRENCVVVTIPVADAVGTPLQKLASDCSVETLYALLPFSPQSGSNACPRIHQFLYNEAGMLIQLSDDGKEALVEFPHLFYESKGQKCARFWLLKSCLLRLADIRQKKQEECVPEPYDYANPHNQRCYQNTIVLTVPWTTPHLAKMFSAGTRFKRALSHDTELAYAVYIVDYQERTVAINHVPKSDALVDCQRDYDTAIKLFVEILKRWALGKEHVFAYVFGGCSIGRMHGENDFCCVTEQRMSNSYTCWRRFDNSTPCHGSDCSGIILRAAQIAGLSYFFKNTTTIGLHLNELPKEAAIKEGDLVLFPGHVMVITDLAKNEIIQAQGYSSGYGCLNSLPLERIFSGIMTLNQLRDHIELKKPLQLLKKDGTFLKEISECKILRISPQK